MKRSLVLLMFLVAVAATAESQECLLTYVSESIPESTINEPIQFQLEVCCGTEPYRFEIIDGVLPDGMHMNAHGKFTGVPRELADNTVFITVTDDAGCSLTQAFPVRVNPPM